MGRRACSRSRQLHNCLHKEVASSAPLLSSLPTALPPLMPPPGSAQNCCSSARRCASCALALAMLGGGTACAPRAAHTMVAHRRNAAPRSAGVAGGAPLAWLQSSSCRHRLGTGRGVAGAGEARGQGWRALLGQQHAHRPAPPCASLASKSTQAGSSPKEGGDQLHIVQHCWEAGQNRVRRRRQRRGALAWEVKGQRSGVVPSHGSAAFASAQE